MDKLKLAGYHRSMKLLGALPANVEGYSTRGKSVSATLLVGAKAGLTYSGKQEGKKISTKEIVGTIKKLRGEQIGASSVGASIINQGGIYKGQPENSLRVQVIFDGSGGETPRAFEKNVRSLAERAAGKLAQREITILWDTPNKRNVVAAASPIKAPSPDSKQFCAWVRKHSKRARTNAKDPCHS